MLLLILMQPVDVHVALAFGMQEHNFCTLPPEKGDPVALSLLQPVDVHGAVASGLGTARKVVPVAQHLPKRASLCCSLTLLQPVDVHVAVANGLGNAKKVLEAVKSGTKQYEFVEVMACPGGCIGGGGQPRSKDKEILKKRQVMTVGEHGYKKADWPLVRFRRTYRVRALS